MPNKRRLVVVSNRLPVEVVHEEGDWTVRPGTGGLVSALAPVLSHRGGLWIGWPGLTSDDDGEDWKPLIVEAFRESGYDLVPITLSAEQVENFYAGFSNQIVWPLFHDLLESCRFKPRFWYGYLDVNRLFAETVAAHARPDDLVWIQDYQVMHVGQETRKLGLTNRLGFFLHIPFPPLDIFLRLPWRQEILQALMAYDLVGFQTIHDRNNFIGCLKRFAPEVKIDARRAIATATLRDRQVRIGAFPIGIDYGKFHTAAMSNTVEEAALKLRSQLKDRRIILGVDRLDYTKGLPHRLRGFRSFLERFPEWHDRVVLRQIVVPSREVVQQYQDLKSEVERLIGEINGRFGSANWVPVNYGYGSLAWEDLIAHYRAADVMLVTSLKDGMNLVSKEYCACQIGSAAGVPVVSEFAGAAQQFRHHALLINPFDAEGVGDAIDQALRMDIRDRRRHMSRLQDIVRHQDIFWWVNRFLQAASDHGLDEYAPEEEDTSSR